MAEERSAQEKTEEPTLKRLQDARKKGQVPRSKELNTFASLIGAGLAMLVLGPLLLGGLLELLKHNLDFDYARAYDSYAIGTELSIAVKEVMLALAPIFLLMCVVTLLSPMALGGFLCTGNQLAPKFDRIDPFKGLARIFSAKGLMELLKAIAKFLLVAITAIFVMSLVLKDIVVLPMQDLQLSMARAAMILVICFLAFSAVLIFVVMMDVPYQLWDHRRQLKMTKQEIKDEMKETEGRPEVKQAIRNRQQEISQRRMMEQVPKADVIITNPTHYAVAILYNQEGKGAPVVVAKGKDHIAAKIREIGREHEVPIFSAPPLARALFASTELNQEIPENLFIAVAQVLAYIYQLRHAAGSRRAMPKPPVNLPVPEEYSRKEQA